MATFCTGTLLAALAWSFPVLLVARVVQASGTAVMMPLLMTTLMAVVPDARPRPGDGQRHAGHVGRPGARPGRLRRGPAVAVLALDLPGGAADRGRHRRSSACASCATSASPSAGTRRLVERGDLGDRLRQPGLRPQRGRPARRPHHGVRRPGRRRARRRAASSGASWCCSARTGRCSTCAPSRSGSSRSRSAAMCDRLHGDARLDDPAAALPAERPRPEPAGDRPAGDARRSGDGSARARAWAASTTPAARASWSSPVPSACWRR